MIDYFSYNDGSSIIPSTSFRISPSQLSDFFDHTSSWYRTQLLGETGFEGSTASYLGTCIHAAAHMYFNTKSVDKATILSYIDSITTPDIDKPLIRSQLKPMIESLINSFLSTTTATHAEHFVHTQIAPNVVAAGTIDLFDANRGIIYDYKTMGSLDTARVPSSFPRSYYFQQITYAYILTQMGYTVRECKLVYISRDNTGRISEKTGKALTDYPSTVNIVTHIITPEDLELISNCLHLVADSVSTWRSNPNFRYLLAQDYRLKLPQSPTIFKD